MTSATTSGTATSGTAVSGSAGRFQNRPPEELGSPEARFDRAVQALQDRHPPLGFLRPGLSGRLQHRCPVAFHAGLGTLQGLDRRIETRELQLDFFGGSVLRLIIHAGITSLRTSG
jgi:hypothetical protein